MFYSSDENEEVDCELDEVARVLKYSVPTHVLHGRCRKTTILGGMTVTEKQFANDEYKRKRKASPDQKRANQLKETALYTETVQFYTGCLHTTLQTMAEVEKSRLKVCHTLPDKELIKLRVAKEANCCGISFHVPRSEV